MSQHARNNPDEPINHDWTQGGHMSEPPEETLEDCQKAYELLFKAHGKATFALDELNARLIQRTAAYEKKDAAQIRTINELRKHLADANRGAETNAKVNAIQAARIGALQADLSALRAATKPANTEITRELQQLCDTWEESK